MSEELSRMLMERKEEVRSESEFVFSDQYGRKIRDGTVEH